MRKIYNIQFFSTKGNEKFPPPIFFVLLTISLLVVFMASCSQSNITQVEEDSDLIEQMREIAPLRLSNPDSVHILLDAIWAENEHRMTYCEKVAFYDLRGITYRILRDFEAAEANLQKALQYLEKLADVDLAQQMQIITSLGNIQADMGEFQNALDTYRQARVLSNNLYNPKQKVGLYLGKGGVFAQIGEVDSALYYIQLVIDIATKENLEELKMYSFERLAFLFFSIGEYAQAEKNIRRAICVSTEFNDIRGLWHNYSNMVIALILQDRLEESLFYAQKADEIAANLGLPQVAMAPYYSRKGQNYLAENNYRNALTMLYRALELQTIIQCTNGIATAKNAMGLAYIGLRDFDKAFFYVNNALKTAQENRIARLEVEAYRNLSVIHAARSNIESSLAAMRAEYELRNKIFTEENSRALHELQIRYEVREKELLIAQQEEKIRYERNTRILTSIIFITVVILLVFIVIFQRRKAMNTARIVQQYETILKLKKETECQTVDLEKVVTISEMSKKLLPEIERLFKEEKIYKQPKLTVDDVAKMLNTNRNYLSTAINECYQKKFPEFVNTFRIDDAIEMLKEQGKGGKYANYTIQAIGEEVGFSNRASFYNACKQVVGVAPLDYIEILNKKQHAESL